MVWLIAGIGILVVIGLFVAAMNRFYRKATRERALIRTGAGGKRVVMDGGCWVLPFLHQVESVDMRTVHVEVRRNGERAVLTADRLRVDITASFHVRVVPTEDGIATAAQALGARSLNQERIADFLSSHFVNAIQGVAAARTMDTLHEERTAFISDIRTALQGELETSGLALESVSLTQFDQTPLAAIDENNAFNAVGMRRLAELITENRRRRKEIEAEAEVAIHRTELETFKSQVNIGIEREQAEIEKRIETERLGALADRRIAEERERAEAEAGRARLRREQDVRQAEIERDRSIRKEEVEALQSVELARLQSQIELAESKVLESKAQAEAERSRSLIVSAEEEVRSTRERLAAEREREIAVVGAAREAETVLRRAKGESAAEVAQAEGHAQASGHRVQALREERAAEAESIAAQIAAENEMSAELIAMRLEERRLKILPRMASKMARPLRSLRDIRIHQISGLGSASGAEGRTSLGANVDDLLDLAFRMPAVRKLGEAVGAEIVTGEREEPSRKNKSGPSNRKT